MATHEYVPADSSHISRAEYDPDARTLAVTFHTNNQTYTHVNVPQEAFDNFRRFRSAGQFYHTVIRRYPLDSYTQGKP